MDRVGLLLIISLTLLTPVTSNLATFMAPIYAAPLGGTDYPWTMFHHDSQRLGVTPASAPTTASLAWSYTTGAQVYASPVVADGIVFVPSWDGKLYALDEYTGKAKWIFTSGAQIFATPAVSNGIVYLASRDGAIYAINEQTGGTLWYVVNISPLTSSPVVADGMVFYGTWLVGSWSHLMALNAANGSVIWIYNGDDYIISSPSVHGGRVFFGQNNGFVVALNETTGAQLWKVAPTGTVQVATAPAVAYGRVYVGTANRFVALDETTGTTVWSFNTGGTAATSGAVNNGAVYFGTGNGNVRAVNSTTGASIWRYSIGASISSSPAIALGSGSLLIGASDNYLYSITLGGSLMWRYLTGAQVSSSPAVADGHVFFGSEDFKIYDLGPQIPKLTTTVAASDQSLKPGEQSMLTINVSNSTGPVTGATVSLSSSSGGGFSQPQETSPGIYVSNYTAPIVGSLTNTVITVTASMSGYNDGIGQTIITLNPFPTLSVAVTPKPSTVSPGGETVLLIKVMNGSNPLPGATIYLTAPAGSFSGLTDSGGGNYTAIYSTPLQTSTMTVTVQASKAGFVTGQAQATVTTSGVPDLTSAKIGGFPLFWVIAGIFVFIFIVFVAAIAKRRSDQNNDFRL